MTPSENQIDPPGLGERLNDTAPVHSSVQERRDPDAMMASEILDDIDLDVVGVQPNSAAQIWHSCNVKPMPSPPTRTRNYAGLFCLNCFNRLPRQCSLTGLVVAGHQKDTVSNDFECARTVRMDPLLQLKLTGYAVIRRSMIFRRSCV